MGFRGWGLGLGPKAPSSGALLLQGAQVAEGPSAEAQQYPEPYSIQKPNSIHKLTAGARKKGEKRPEFLVINKELTSNEVHFRVSLARRKRHY